MFWPSLAWQAQLELDWHKNDVVPWSGRTITFNIEFINYVVGQWPNYFRGGSMSFKMLLSAVWLHIILLVLVLLSYGPGTLAIFKQIEDTHIF